MGSGFRLQAWVLWGIKQGLSSFGVFLVGALSCSMVGAGRQNSTVFFLLQCMAGRVDTLPSSGISCKLRFRIWGLGLSADRKSALDF